MTIIVPIASASSGISDYNELVATILRASYRSDLSGDIDTFIQLCESDMQTRLRLVDLEDTATLTVTAGSASLPTDYAGMRNVYWDVNTDRPLQYLTPDKFDSLVLTANMPKFYTIKGVLIKFSTTADGSAVVNYQARFTGLSSVNLTNAIIVNYPDAYVHGTMAQLFIFTRDMPNAQVRQMAYEAAIDRIIKDNNKRKYGNSLQVRVA